MSLGIINLKIYVQNSGVIKWVTEDELLIVDKEKNECFT